MQITFILDAIDRLTALVYCSNLIIRLRNSSFNDYFSSFEEVMFTCW